MATKTAIQERDHRFVELLAAGRSIAECAAELGVSVTTAYRMYQKPPVRVALARQRAAHWHDADQQIRAGVSHAIARLLHLIDNAQSEAVQLRASISLIELATGIDARNADGPLRESLEQLLSATGQSEQE